MRLSDQQPISITVAGLHRPLQHHLPVPQLQHLFDGAGQARGSFELTGCNVWHDSQAHLAGPPSSVDLQPGGWIEPEIVPRADPLAANADSKLSSNIAANGMTSSRRGRCGPVTIGVRK